MYVSLHELTSREAGFVVTEVWMMKYYEVVASRWQLCNSEATPEGRTFVVVPLVLRYRYPKQLVEIAFKLATEPGDCKLRRIGREEVWELMACLRQPWVVANEVSDIIRWSYLADLLGVRRFLPLHLHCRPGKPLAALVWGASFGKRKGPTLPRLPVREQSPRALPVGSFDNIQPPLVGDNGRVQPEFNQPVTSNDKRATEWTDDTKDFLHYVLDSVIGRNSHQVGKGGRVFTDLFLGNAVPHRKDYTLSPNRLACNKTIELSLGPLLREERMA